jgi:RHS repeat-associated protein
MGCLKLERNMLLRIAHTSNSERSGEGKYRAGLYRYKYNGKEYQDELGLNFYDYGARNYDAALGRWMNVDPLAEISRRFSPYTYGLNNPIYFIDVDGMYADPGDFYGNNGKHLGSDGINDNKVYRADSVEKNKDGLVTSAKNSTDLGITHTEFRKQASTVYAESSAYKSNSVTDDLKKEMFAIASVHQKNSLAFGANSDKAMEYLASTPSTINKSEFKTTANASVINALTGGFDYSNGATMWDGREQALFQASDNRRSTGKFELHMNTMGWNITDSNFKTWKTNVGSAFQAPQQKVAPANFGNYQNKGMMRLQSTAVYGETIFWKIK